MEQRLNAEKMIDYIENNLDEDLTLEHMEEEFHYCKSYLARIFSKEKGGTIYQYVKKRRVEEAAKKLQKTDKAIAEIAYEAHYGSQQAFTLAFRQVYLVAPQVYRRQYTLLRQQAGFLSSTLVYHYKVQMVQRRLVA